MLNVPFSVPGFIAMSVKLISVLPNIQLSSCISAGPLSIVPANDPQLEAIVSDCESSRRLLHHFKTPFNESITPSALIADEASLPMDERAILAFRNIVSLCIHWDAARSKISNNQFFGPYWTDYFDLYPYIPSSRKGSLLAMTPGAEKGAEKGMSTFIGAGEIMRENDGGTNSRSGHSHSPIDEVRPMRTSSALFVTLSVITTLSLGCAAAHNASQDAWPKETVMTPGMVIEATNENGTIRVTCKQGGNKRTYRWNGHEKTFKLMTRKSRWDGKLGIYLPVYKWPLTPASFSAEEAILHGETVEDVMRYLAREPSMRYVYTSDGLVVGYGVFGTRNNVDITVYQILINGEKPEALPGADDSAIKITYEPL